MASIDPSLISDPKEHNWAIEINEIFDHQLDIDVETPSVSIFQVPETISQKKPEAYEPQQIGLGPIHHFRPQPYKKMEQKKLAVMRKVLKEYDIKIYKLHVLDKVRKFVPTVRSCYDMFLRDDEDSLARIFAIDGLFLLNLFLTYINSPVDEYLLLLKNKAHQVKQEEEDFQRRLVEDDEYKGLREEDFDELHPLLREKEIVVTMDNQIEWEEVLDVPHHELNSVYDAKKRLAAQDILMVENQIPFMVLKEINDALHSSSGSRSSNLVNNFSPSIYRTFCEIHSPLKLCSQSPSSVDHVLHYMYYSIVPEDKKKKPDVPKDDQPFKGTKRKQTASGHVSNFISKLPQKEIVQAYEQTISILEIFSTKETIIIPSVSKLHGKAGFKFHSLEENQGIQNIHILGKNIYLPRMTLNNGSDVILRNLVAYETITAKSNSFPLNEYMGLMCGLIMNKDDASYLKKLNVIIGDMSADEVAKLFTGMSSSIATAKTKKKSKLQEVIDEINTVYESRLSMKTHLLLKKLARWLLVVLRAIGSFVESSWKIVAFMVSIVTVFMLTWQAYCDVYGCDKQTVTLLPYASS